MLLSVDQVAERVGVHPSTLRRWLRAGLQQQAGLPSPLPVKAVGRGPRWRADDVDRWREQNMRGMPAASSGAFSVDADPVPRLAVVR